MTQPGWHMKLTITVTNLKFIINQRLAWFQISTYSTQFSSVAQLCPTLCNPMDCSTPGFPVHHQLAQTHVHWVGWSHPTILSSVIPFSSHLQYFQASESFPISQFFASLAKVLEFQLQHQLFQWIFRTDFLQNGLGGSPCSLRDSQVSSPTPQFKSINSSVLSLLHSPTLTSLVKL